LANLGKGAAPKQKHLTMTIPNADDPQKIVYAHDFDTTTQTLHEVWIWELRDGHAVTSYAADSAQWQGKTWVLRGVKRSENTPSGPLEESSDSLTYDIGKSPWDVAHSKPNLEDMSMKELALLGEGLPGRDMKQVMIAREERQMRLALPWAALGLALVGLPLGIRPQRTSTGVGLGLSLGIILLYYIIVQLMRILGQNGALPPMMSDWIPNVLLYTIGLGLLINASR
jgi:lipopolysaccharide export system permease protein